jgi:hypothetical protein
MIKGKGERMVIKRSTMQTLLIVNWTTFFAHVLLRVYTDYHSLTQRKCVQKLKHCVCVQNVSSVRENAQKC